MAIFLAPTGALEEGILCVHACVRVSVRVSVHLSRWDIMLKSSLKEVLAT